MHPTADTLPVINFNLAGGRVMPGVRRQHIMFIVSASIDELDASAVVCFDPTRIVHRIIDEFPEAVVCVHDYAWQDHDHFRQRCLAEGWQDGLEGALRIAESDARWRGPIYVFRLRTDGGPVVSGSAERYRIRISSDEPIPEGLKERFTAFLRSMRAAPVEVKSVRLAGNDEFPA